MKRKLPALASDDEAETFVASADLTEFDLSQMRAMKFEFAPKDERINMRLPRDLLDAVKERAAKQKMPYQRFIRAVLEAAVETKSGRRSRGR